MYAKINNNTFTIIDKDNNKILIEELNKLMFNNFIEFLKKDA